MWEPLWQAYLEFYGATLPKGVLERTWLRLNDSEEPMWGALAWSGETAVGLVHYIFHRTCWSERDACYLQDLFVTPACRGGGIGAALIDHVRLSARGCAEVHWLTHESNATARRLYDRVAERSGFIEYSCLAGFGSDSSRA